MSPLCPYRNVFGRPGEGVHRHRVFGVAIVDVLLTLLAAVLIGVFTKTSIALVAALLFAAGIVLHRLFCVRTTVDTLLFGGTTKGDILAGAPSGGLR